MASSLSEKLATIIEQLEKLKEAKEQYYAKWPDTPLLNQRNPRGKPHWQENVQPLINQVELAWTKLESQIASLWPYDYPEWPTWIDARDIIRNQRNPRNMNAVIQGFGVVQCKLEGIEAEQHRQIETPIPVPPPPVEPRPPTPEAASGQTALQPIEDDATLSPKQIAEKTGVPLEPLRKRLELRRRKDDGCFIELSERRLNEPQFLYKYGHIKDIVEKLKTSNETSNKRPAQKKSS